MYGHYLSVAIGELFAATTANLYIFWKVILTALIVVMLIEFIIPFFRKICILKTVANRRAKIDTHIKFTNEEKMSEGFRKLFNKLTKFIRKPAYFLRRYLFHYKKSRYSIARMNRLRVYQKNKTRNNFFRFVARYYAFAIIFIAFVFIFYFIYIRMQYQE